MSEYYNTGEGTKERGNWVDDFSQIGETLTGLAGSILPFFGKNPTNQKPKEDDYWTEGGGTGTGGGTTGGGTPPPKPPQTGKIILFSVLGLGAVGTAVYFLVRKKQ
jgi:LPXTG-motif cell wall-anchored protein